MDLREATLQLHREYRGKIALTSKVKVKDRRDLSLVYSPGVAEPCLEIARDGDNIFSYTAKGNLVAVVTDGSAVLGLGNIGARAALPVMEGKAILFKEFAGIDAFPICIDSQNPEKIVEVVRLIAPVFGGINLEDIAAPHCFLIERRLRETLDIPVFHDDQHGTAVVVLSALINALRLVNKKMKELRIVISGAGAAGIATAKLLLQVGVREIILCDRLGTIYPGREEGMNFFKEEIVHITNPREIRGSLPQAMEGADVFIGVSVANLLAPETVASMNKDAIVFALANPVPEILPEKALVAGARIVATGRSDYSNQVNNVLGFPGIFRGALDVRAKEINNSMLVAASWALADLIKEELREDYIIPSPFDSRVVPTVAKAVAKAARESGVARMSLGDDHCKENISRG